MTGTVTEESGAVVPDARIELADITTGTTYSSLSSDLGILVFRRCRIGGSSATIQLLQLLDVKGGAKLGHWGGVKVHRLRERTRF